MSVYHFGECVLDTSSGELLRNGHRVRLRPQPAAALEWLLRHPGRVISREDLRRVLWPDGTHVHFDHGLNSCIKQLRAALGDDRGTPSYIETLTRRGYRFIAPVGVDATGVPGPVRRARVAVLPFARLTPAVLGPPLADGLTDDVTARLTTADPAAIAVVGRPAARSGEAPADEPPVNADFAVSGSVRVIGRSFRVTVRLTSLGDDVEVWASVFDGELDDLLDAQARIADAISTSVLRAVRGGEPRETVATTSQADAIAV